MSAPGAPNIYVRPRAFLDSVKLYWRPPTDIGSSAITSYTINCAQASYSQSFGPDTKSATIPGLSLQTDYTFTITATNSTGTGPVATYRTVQVGLAPSQPSAVSVIVPTSTSANVSWTFTPDANQAPTHWFVIKAIPSTIQAAPVVVQSAHGTERGRTVSNLSTNITYSFLVQAINDVAYTIVSQGSKSSFIHMGPLPPPPASSFDPNTLPGLVFYADMSTLPLGAITEILNQLPASDITLSISLSGTGTVVADGLGSKKVLNMTNTDQFIGTTLNLPNYTIFTVAQRISSDGYVFTDGANNLYGYLDASVPGFNLHSSSSSISYDSNNPWTTPTWDIQTLSKWNDVNGVNIVFNWNGTNALTGTSATYANEDALLTNFSINTNNPSTNSIAAIYIFDTALSPLDIQIMEGYLAQAWNLQANLPSNHPYKTNGPTNHTPLFWSPTQINGCQLWLDGADPATITATGTNVSQWNDKSGNNNNATGTATYHDNALVFDGSTNGLTTTYKSIPILHIACINGGFATSYDGLVWQKESSTIFSGGQANNITYTGSFFIAVGLNTSASVCIAKSTDGFTWTPSTNNPFSGNNGVAIAWNGSYAVAVGNNSDLSVCIATSSDGLIWTPSTNNPFSGGGGGSGIAWNGVYWVAVGANSGGTVCIAKSSDGLNWAPSTNNPFSGQTGRGIAWSGSYWVAVGENSGASVCFAKSTDGLNWTPSTNNPFSGGNSFGIAWNGSYWVAAGGNSNQSVCIAKSVDGLTWTPSTNNPFINNQGYSISWDGTYWLAGALNSGGVARSVDGLNWTSSISFPESVYGFISKNTEQCIETAFVVLSLNSTVSQDIISGSDSGDREYFYNGTNLALGAIDGTYVTNGGNVTQNTLTMLTYTTDSANTNFYTNATQEGYNSTTLAFPSVGYTTIGFNGLNSNNYLNGSISEVLIYNRVLSQDERQNIEGYLAWKWGLQPVIPQTHPYVYAPPNVTHFNPTLIKNCVFWVDASDPLNNNTIPANNATINTWYDKSGQANNLIAVTGILAPTFSPAYINNLPAINFSNIAGLYTNPFPKSENVTVLWVGQMNHSANAQGTIWGHYEIGNNTSQITLQRTLPTRVDFETGNTSTSYFSSSYSPSLYSCTMKDGLYITGQQINGAGTNTINYTATSKTWTSGNAPVWVGINQDNSSTYFMDGYVSEILYYQRVLTPTEKQVAEGYLAWKYGLQSYLPSGHPYQGIKPKPNEPTTWTPTNIPNVSFWLDGADISGNLAIGASVTQWNDKSSNHCNAIQSNSTIAPLAQVGGGVYFDGATNELSFSDPNYPILYSTGSFFFVSTPSSSANTYFYASGNNAGIIMNFGPNAVSTFNFASNDNIIVSNTPTPPPVLLFNIIRKNNTYMNAYYQGEQAIFTTNATTNPSSVYMTSLGSGQGSAFFGGTIYEVLFFNVALTDNQRQVVEGYLAWKWNVTLASSHPFALRPPKPNESTNWSVNNLPNLNLWIDGQDSKSVVNADGNPGKVLQVLDKSGYNNHMAQKTGVINVNNTVFNELNAMALSQTYFTGTFNKPITTPQYSAFSVATMNSATGVGGRILGLGQLGNDDYNNTSSAIAFSRTSGQNIMTERNGTALSLPLSAYNTPFLIYSSQQPSTAYLSLNGQTPQSVASGTTSAFNINTYGLGTNTNYEDSGSYWTGTIGEIILTNTTLPTNQRQIVEGYLAWKWNIEENLPMQHPYYLAPPSLINKPLEWLPTQAGPLEFWYDASTLNYDNDQTITNWLDRTNNTTLTTTYSKTKPTLTRNGLNYLPVASFTNGQSLQVTNLVTGINQSVFAVARQTGGINGTVFGSSQNNSQITIGYEGGNKKAININGHPHVSSAVPSDSAWDLISLTVGEYANDLFPYGMYDSVWNGSYWLATGISIDSTTIFAISINGYQWTLVNTPLSGSGSLAEIAWSSTQNKWAVCGNSADSTIQFATSPDGLNWTSSTDNSYQSAYAITTNGPLWIAMGYNAGIEKIVYSSDGLSWTQSTTQPITYESIRDISWNSNQSLWVAVGYNSDTVKGIIFTSTDGDTWTKTILDSSGALRAVRNNGSQWLIASNSAHILLSADAVSWTQVQTPNIVFNYFAWNGSLWVGAGVDNVGVALLAYSTDAQNWTRVTNITDAFFNNIQYFNNVVWGNNQFMGLITPIQSKNPSYFTSFDGINWIYPPVQSTTNKYNFAWNGTQISTGTDVFPISSFQLNGQYEIGQYSDCQIAEVLFFNASLSLAQQQAVEGYLAWKWGLQTNLPVNHPYYNSAPKPNQQISWLPSSLANSGLWLEGSDPYNNQATLTDNSLINVWNDKLLLAKATDIRYSNVRIKNNVVNTHSIIRFDENSAIGLHVLYPNIPPAFTIIFVHNIGSNINDSTIIVDDTNTIKINTSLSGAINFNNPNRTINPSVIDKWAMSVCITDSYNVRLFSNGTLLYSVMNNSLLSIITNLKFCEYQKADIAEVILYEWALTDAQRLVVEGYLASKYAIQSVLLSSHPYKEKAPAVNEPTDLLFTGLQLWLDGADQSTMTFSGSTVTQWNDKSGNNNNTTGISGTPTYNNSTGVVFDGNSYFNLPNGAIPYNNSAYSIYIVATVNSTSNTNGILSAGTSNDDSSILIENNGTYMVTGWVNDNNTTTGTISQGTPFLFESFYDNSVSIGGRYVYLNGSTDTIDSPNTRKQPNGPNLLGSNFNGNMIGTISEILVYNYPHTYTQRLYIEGHLAWKWNIQGALSNANPFYAYPPVLKTSLQSVTENYSLAGGTCTNSQGLSYSPDGLNWFDSHINPFQGSVGGQIQGLAYGNGTWIATGYNYPQFSITVAVSKDDGKTWTPSTNNPFANNQGWGVAYNGYYFVAIGSNSGNSVNFAASSDGYNWIQSTSNPFATGYNMCIAWNGSYWLAGDLNNDGSVTIVSSVDGLNWIPTATNPFIGGVCFCLAWSARQGQWVAGGNNSGSTVCIATSPDGQNWTPSANNPFLHGNMWSVAWSDKQSLWVGGGLGDYGSLAYSSDGTNWTSSPITTNPFIGGTCISLTWNGHHWLAAGYSTGGPIWDTVYPVWGNNSSNIQLRCENLLVSADGKYWLPATNSTIPAVTFSIRSKFNTPPDPVTNVTISNVTIGGFTVNYIPSTRALSYIFKLNGVLTTPISQATNTATFSYLEPSTLYNVEVLAVNDYGITSSAFQPQKVLGNQLWLDGADPLASGTAPAVGTAITTWYDKSGQQRNAVGSNSPLTVANNQIALDGTSQYFTVPYAGQHAIETAFVVMNVTQTSTTQDIICSDTASGSREIVLFSGLLYAFVSGVGPVATQPLPPTETQVLLEYALNQNFSSTLYYSGNQNYFIPAGYPYQPENSIAIGYNPVNNNSFLGGTISEVLIYNTILSTSDRQKVEGYLAWKWGLQSSSVVSMFGAQNIFLFQNNLLDTGLTPVTVATKNNVTLSSIDNKKSLYFSDGSSKISMPLFTGLTYTISFWAYVVSGGSNFIFVTTSGAEFNSAQGINCSVNGSFFNLNGFTWSPATIYNQWHHFAFTVDTDLGNYEFYGDGALIGSSSITGAFPMNYMYFGTLETSNNSATMYIKYLTTHNTILSSTEITNLYNATQTALPQDHPYFLNSPPSAVAVTTGNNSPDVTNLGAYTKTANTITLKWLGGLGATSYKYYVDSSEVTPTTDNGVSSRTAIISGLTSHTAYTIYVEAHSVAEGTHQSNTITVSTLYDTVTPITGLSATSITETTAQITWSGGTYATQYNYVVNGNANYSGSITDDGLASQTLTFNALTTSTTYTVKVIASNPNSSTNATITFGTFVPTSMTLSVDTTITNAGTYPGFTVNVYDQNSAGLAGETVVLSSSIGDSASMTDNGGGAYTYNGFTDTNFETVTYTASIGSLQASTVDVTYTDPGGPPPPDPSYPASISLISDLSSTDVSNNVVFTASVYDQYTVPYTGDTVYLTSTYDNVQMTDNNDGTYSVTIAGSGTPETVSYTASDGSNTSNTVDVTYNPV